MERRFARANFIDANDQGRAVLCAELSAILARRMREACAFHAGARGCIEELRAIGHDLCSFDESDEFQIWCPNYQGPAAPGIVVRFSHPDEVSVEWSVQQ